MFDEIKKEKKAEKEQAEKLKMGSGEPPMDDIKL
jgi:hypothetical protein